MKWIVAELPPHLSILARFVQERPCRLHVVSLGFTIGDEGRQQEFLICFEEPDPSLWDLVRGRLRAIEGCTWQDGDVPFEGIVGFPASATAGFPLRVLLRFPDIHVACLRCVGSKALAYALAPLEDRARSVLESLQGMGAHVEHRELGKEERRFFERVLDHDAFRTSARPRHTPA